MTGDMASTVVEQVARLSYGKLVAVLAVRSGDIAGAEDALGEALVRAIIHWREHGIPHNPEAWLVTAARRIDSDRWRRAVTAASGADRWLLLEDERLSAQEVDLPDDRLRLMLVCAHPAIDPEMHTPLMLQVVLGVDARRIASAFLVAPSTMGQRLSRAKARIGDSGLRFELPGREALAQRIDAVLTAVYGAYSLGWDLAFADSDQGRDLVDEALWLMRVVVETLPDHAEARALLALGLLTEARRKARRDPQTGAFVPLHEQRMSGWRLDLINAGEDMLRAASALGPPGRFGYEAAIQAVHAARRKTGHTDWSAIEHLYRGLLGVSATVGARIGHAVAMAEVAGPESGLQLLDRIQPDACQFHQPYWVAKAHLLANAGRVSEARDCYDRAIALTEDSATRRFLLDRRMAVIG